MAATAPVMQEPSKEMSAAIPICLVTSPDEDFVDLIDKTVTEGQIDSLKAVLVRSLMHASGLNWAEQRENDVVLFVVLEN